MTPVFSDVNDQFPAFIRWIFSDSGLHCALLADCTEDSCSCTLVNFWWLFGFLLFFPFSQIQFNSFFLKLVISIPLFSKLWPISRGFAINEMSLYVRAWSISMTNLWLCWSRMQSTLRIYHLFNFFKPFQIVNRNHSQIHSSFTYFSTNVD